MTEKKIFCRHMKGHLTVEYKLNFHIIMHYISPQLTAFTISGIGVFKGLSLITYPTLKAAKNYLYKR